MLLVDADEMFDEELDVFSFFSCEVVKGHSALAIKEPNVGDNPPQPGRDCGSEKARTLRSG